MSEKELESEFKKVELETQKTHLQVLANKETKNALVKKNRRYLARILTVSEEKSRKKND